VIQQYYDRRNLEKSKNNQSSKPVTQTKSTKQGTSKVNKSKRSISSGASSSNSLSDFEISDDDKTKNKKIGK
jgi:hypothetical protein